ncbi:MAG: hypothetical protein IKV94_01465 [Clostridia bacterium]|nr:hypothetical protein [Clostridia bacterium]
MKQTKNKKFNWEKIIGLWVFVSFIIPIIYLIFKIIYIKVTGISATRSIADYVLILAQCILGVVAMNLPTWISKKTNILVPSFMYMTYIIFLYCAIFLGEVRSFYYTVPNWDTILHTFSGAMLGALGFSIINILNNEEKLHMNLTPLFVAVFAFCFSVTLGSLWEIYEFSFDGILGINMQKFATVEGTELVGRQALTDTMKDIIVDCIGAAVMSIVGYLQLKYKSGTFNKILIKIKK